MIVADDNLPRARQLTARTARTFSSMSRIEVILTPSS